MLSVSVPARSFVLLVVLLGLGLAPAAAEPTLENASVKTASVTDVLRAYADMAEVGYADALATAKTLQLAVNQLLAKPTEERPRMAGRDRRFA
jgi:putative iron-regulated protein